MKHQLPVCMLVWYSWILQPEDSLEEEICEQGYADLRLNGINSKIAKKMRRIRGDDFVQKH